MFQTNKKFIALQDCFYARKDLAGMVEVFAELSNTDLEKLTDYFEKGAQACYLAKQMRLGDKEFYSRKVF